MSFAEKAALLEKKEYSCIAVFGDDYFFIDKFTKLYLKKVLNGSFEDNTVVVFDLGQKEREIKINEIEEAVFTVSMFSDKKAIVLKDLYKLNKDNLLRVYDICGNLPAGVYLVLQSLSVTEVRLKELKQYAKNIPVFDFSNLGALGAKEAALEKLNEMKKKIDPEVLDFVIEEANNDPAAIIMEIEKMCLYAGDSEKITKEHFNGIKGVEKGYDIWSLTNAFASLDQKKTFIILEKTYDFLEPEIIIGAIFGTIKRIYIYKFYKKAGKTEEAFKLGGGGVNFIKGFEPLFKAPYFELASIIKEADRKIKLSARDTAKSIIYLMFERLFQRISGKKKSE